MVCKSCGTSSTNTVEELSLNVNVTVSLCHECNFVPYYYSHTLTFRIINSQGNHNVAIQDLVTELMYSESANSTCERYKAYNLLKMYSIIIVNWSPRCQFTLKEKTMQIGGMPLVLAVHIWKQPEG